VAFRVLDVHELDFLQHDEIFRMYKMLFSSAISDDSIVDLVFKLLEREGLETNGKITYEDFSKVGNYITGRFIQFARLLGTRFDTRNCINGPLVPRSLTCCIFSPIIL
jgi:hypothetical protein